MSCYKAYEAKNLRVADYHDQWTRYRCARFAFVLSLVARRESGQQTNADAFAMGERINYRRSSHRNGSRTFNLFTMRYLNACCLHHPANV